MDANSGTCAATKSAEEPTHSAWRYQPRLRVRIVYKPPVKTQIIKLEEILPPMEPTTLYLGWLIIWSWYKEILTMIALLYILAREVKYMAIQSLKSASKQLQYQAKSAYYTLEDNWHRQFTFRLYTKIFVGIGVVILLLALADRYWPTHYAAADLPNFHTAENLFASPHQCLELEQILGQHKLVYISGKDYTGINNQPTGGYRAIIARTSSGYTVSQAENGNQKIIVYMLNPDGKINRMSTFWLPAYTEADWQKWVLNYRPIDWQKSFTPIHTQLVANVSGTEKSYNAPVLVNFYFFSPFSQREELLYARLSFSETALPNYPETLFRLLKAEAGLEPYTSSPLGSNIKVLGDKDCGSVLANSSKNSQD